MPTIRYCFEYFKHYVNRGSQLFNVNMILILPLKIKDSERLLKYLAPALLIL